MCLHSMAIAAQPLALKPHSRRRANSLAVGIELAQVSDLGAHRMSIFSRARARTGSTSYFWVGQANIICRKREA